MRVFGWFKPPCEMKVTDEKVSYRHHRPINIYMSRFESEHNCWDPKDGDLSESLEPEFHGIDLRKEIDA